MCILSDAYDTALCKSIRPNDIKGYASSGAEFQPVKRLSFNKITHIVL